MAYQYTNAARTTLASTITNSATTLVLSDATNFPATGNFPLLVEQELMLCTARSGTSCTVTRAQEGTSAAGHTAGVAVVSPLTAASLLGIAASLQLANVGGTAISSPSSGQVLRHDGSAFANATQDSKYFLAASDAVLPNGIVIPGLAGSANIAGAAGGGGVSEEYDSSTTGLTWTGSTPNTVDSNTTIKSHLYALSIDTTERFGLRAWTVGGDGSFDARCHLSLGQGAEANVAVAGFVIADSGNTNRVVVQTVWDSSNHRMRIQAFTYAGSYTQRGSDQLVPANYFRISRDASNNVSFWWSLNGLTWMLMAKQAFTFTVAQIGYRLTASSGTSATLVSDWLRTNV